MSPILILVAAVVIIGFVVLAALAKAKGKGAEEAEVGRGSDYELAQLFSPAERSFLGVLEGLLPDGVGLLAKVRLGDVFRPKKGIPKWTAANNRLNRKHIDFLIVRTSDLSPVAGIELDDSSHQRADRKARDTFVDDVFKASDLPLLHVTAKATYNPNEIRQSVAELLRVGK
jgi:hypothetical protein